MLRIFYIFILNYSYCVAIFLCQFSFSIWLQLAVYLTKNSHKKRNLYYKRTYLISNVAFCCQIPMFVESMEVELGWTNQRTVILTLICNSDSYREGIRSIWDIGCSECKMLGMCHVRNVVSLGCEMLGICDARDVARFRYEMLGMRDVRDVARLGYEMLEMCDVCDAARWGY